jgi:hypothetical protein
MVRFLIQSVDNLDQNTNQNSTVQRESKRSEEDAQYEEHINYEEQLIENILQNHQLDDSTSK